MGKVRLADIAKAVGVSKTSASKVLSKTEGNNTHVSAETAKRILDAARQMGYRPNLAARQLAGQNSRLLGVLIDANSIFNEFPRIIYTEQVASSLGYRMIVGQCHPDFKDIKLYLDDFEARSVDGLIMHAHAYPDQALQKQIVEAASRFRNVVYYDRPDGDVSKLSFIDIDLAKGMKKLVRHLAATGRKRIIYFVPYMRFPLGKFRSFRERERGFREGMEECGLPFDPDFAKRYLFAVEPVAEQIAPLVRELVLKERPDTIIARNDEVAAIVLKTLLEIGVQCPADIAVAGYDNRSFAEHLHPSLTSVDPNLPLASKLAADALAALIAGEKPPIQKQVEPEVIARESA